MSAVGRRMDITGDFTSRATSTSASLSHSRVSSTSGDGEHARTALNLNAKRKPRRKTITLNEPSRTANSNANPSAAYRDGAGGQSVSESAFGNPPCSPLRLPPLQTSGFSFNSFPNAAIGATAADLLETTTPRRMSSRIAALSASNTTAVSNDTNSALIMTAIGSPTKARTLTTSASGGNLKSINSQNKTMSGNQIHKKPSPIRETSVVSISSEGGRFGGRGKPRTSTLPAHFTDSLMRMKISRDDTSVESLTLNTPTGVPNFDPYDPNEIVDGGDGMDIDDGTGQAQIEMRPVLAVTTNVLRRGRPRRRARSLPPTPVLVSTAPPEENDNDADDEGEGTNGTPTIAPTLSSPRKKRGRAGPSTILGARADASRGDPASGAGEGATMLGDHVIMPGIELTDSPTVLRRSARHVRRGRMPGQANIGDSGGSQEVRDIEDVAHLGATRLGGMGAMGVLGAMDGMEEGGGITRKRARTREDRDDSRGRLGMVIGDERDKDDEEFLEGRVFKRSRRR